jgi:hypothetical protein
MGPAGDMQLTDINTLLRSITNLDELSEDYLFCVKLIERVQRRWSLRMNLYHHNCQHFSDYVLALVAQDEVCVVEYEQPLAVVS